MATIRSIYSQRNRVSLSEFEPSLAKQQFRDDADINVILKKYQDTGIPPEPSRAAAHYGDFSNVDDYQTALNSVMAANASFDALPAELRARFHHDPAQLLQFVLDDKNLAEAESLGLIQKTAPKPSEELSTPPASKQEV